MPLQSATPGHLVRVTAREMLADPQLTTPSHEPAACTVLDLGSVADRDARELEAAWGAGAPGLLVGWAPEAISPAAARLLPHLSTTVSPLDWKELPPSQRRFVVRRDWASVDRLAAAVSRQPVAALMLDRLLRSTAGASHSQALLVESSVYATLLGSEEHATWLAGRGHARPAADVPEPVSLLRMDNELRICLDRPARRNAFGRQMRDALVDALDLALLDRDLERVVLTASGPCFSAGGDLDEFGTLRDPASATLLRLSRSPGPRILALGARLEAVVHGACVGAGVEVPAFAHRLLALPDTWFLLPELSMGLVPGAGGTVSVTRRVGRWKAAYMMLSGERIELDEAISWGLVDDVVA